MSHATSRSGSEVSARSSLKGWGSGPTPNSANTPVSHDEEATRASNSPYGGVPLSAVDPKALRPNSSPCLAPRMEGGEASKPMEQQIKQERIWWSEQTLFEVQKMELALKQELHKTTAGLREQFRRQMEVERNEAQQRTSNLDRAISRLREEFDTFSQQDSSKSAAQAEASLRLELNGMRCSLEDFKRQQVEDLSVRLAKDDTDKARLVEEVRSTKELLATLEAKTAESAERAMKHIEALRQDVKRMDEILEEEQSAKRDKSAGELKTKIQDVAALLDRECQTRQAEVAAMRQEWRSEIGVTTKDIANELLKRRSEMDAVKENLKAIEAKATRNGGVNMKDFTDLVEIECKARENDVAELRRQLELTEALLANGNSRDVQTLDDFDLRLGRLVSAIDLERDHRRSDSERHHAALSDIMDSVKAERTLRANEVEKLRSALAQLALNLQSAASSSEVSSRWSEAFASLRSSLEDSSKSQESEQGEGKGEEALGGHTITQLGREVAELANQLHQIHQQVLAQDSSAMQVAAKLRGEVQAKSAELRGDLAGLRTELLQKLEDAGPETSPAGQPGELPSSGGGLALAGQMHELMRLVQIIAQGTEHLGEKLCDEVSDRRQADATLAGRLSFVERFVGEVPGPPEVMGEVEFSAGSPLSLSKPPSDGATGSGGLLQPGGFPTEGANKQSLVSDSLKDSLEQLVTRVNRMLKPEQEKRTPRQGRSLNTSTAASRDNSMQQTSGDFGGALRPRQQLDRQISNSKMPNSGKVAAPGPTSPKPEARNYGTPQVGTPQIGGPSGGRASFVAGQGPTSVIAPSQPRQANPQPKQLQRVPGTTGYAMPAAGFPVFRMPTQQPQVVPMAKAAR